MNVQGQTVGLSLAGVFACLVGYNTIVIEPLRAATIAEDIRTSNELMAIRKEQVAMQNNNTRNSVILENLTTAINKLTDKLEDRD